MFSMFLLSYRNTRESLGKRFSFSQTSTCVSITQQKHGHVFYLLTGKLEPYLSNRVGRTMSGLIRARFWRAPAASKLPLLLNTASMTAGFRHSTNAVRSSSFSLDSSGMGVTQDFFGNLSLTKTTTQFTLLSWIKCEQNYHIALARVNSVTAATCIHIQCTLYM